MSEEVGIILREAVPGDAKDILLMMGQVNKETGDRIFSFG